MEIQGIPHDKLLNVQEVANLTGQARQTIYQYVSARKIPFIKVGRSVRFNSQEILEWLEGKKVAAIPARG